MKKMFTIVLALAVICFMAAPSLASDQLALSGQMRVQYHAHDNTNGSYYGWNPSAGDDSYFKQRFRLGGVFTPAEGISTHFRVDLAEGVWGDGFNGSRQGWASSTESTEIGVDNAYLQIDKELWNLKAGQFWNGHGSYMLWDELSTGIQLNIKLNPVTVTLHYAKMDEGGSVTDEADGIAGTSTLYYDCDAEDCTVITTSPSSSQDTDFIGVVLDYAHESFTLGIMYAQLLDDGPMDDSPYGIGIYGNTKLGPVNFSGELDFFGGEIAASNIDYIGTQFYLDANMQVLDNLLIGGQFLYALGTDDEMDKQRTAILQGDEGFNPFGWRGPFGYSYYPMGSAYGGGDNANLPNGGYPAYSASMWDVGGESTGVVGGTIYADWQIIESLQATANLGYATPQEDSFTHVDSFLTFGVTLDYRLAANTSLQGGYFISSPDFDDDTDDDAATYFLSQLQVNF